MIKKYNCGLLPLSGDPITFGHLDIIERSAKECDRLVIAILDSPGKSGTYLFDEDERKDHVKRAVKEFCTIENCEIEVIFSQEEVTDLFLTYNCDALFRGVRDNFDLEYETTQLKYHDLVLPGIAAKTVMLKADSDLKHVQSTVARNFAVQHLDATSMVPMFVQARMWRVIYKQKMVGITGAPGVGKTHLAEVALDVIRKNGMPAHYIDLDWLASEMLLEKTPGIEALNKRLAENRGQTVPEEVKNLFVGFLYREYRKALYGKKGIILVESTLFAELELCHWVNNNMVLITCEEASPTEKIDPIKLVEPFSPAAKLAACKAVAEKDKYGLVFNFENKKDTFDPGLGGIIVAKAKGGGI